MRYCPYCSEPVSEKAKTCHNCKAVLDIGLIAELFDTADESEMKKSVLRKIKIKERMRFVWPAITLVIGFIIGGIMLYLAALGQFAIQKGDLNSQIDSLQIKIKALNLSTENAQSGLQEQIAAKEKVIEVLGSQRTTLSRIINFTRNFADNCIITPNSEGDVTSFRNNFLYLKRQFENQQEELDKTEFKDSGHLNLKTIPKFLDE
jgi:hypothetical protein